MSSITPAVNLQLFLEVSSTFATGGNNVSGKVAASVNIAGGLYAAGVNDTGSARRVANIFAKLSKTIKMLQMELSGREEDDSWKKPEVKNLVTRSLPGVYCPQCPAS